MRACFHPPLRRQTKSGPTTTDKDERIALTISMDAEHFGETVDKKRYQEVNEWAVRVARAIEDPIRTA